MPKPTTPVYVRSTRQSGFTLVELVIVMAITSTLALIAIVGQRQLRDRSDFDTAVDQVIQNVAYARNYATSNVNFLGNGNNTNVLVVGDGLEINDAHISHNPPYPLEELETTYASPSANGGPDPATYNNCPPGYLDASNVCNCPPAQHVEDQSECIEQFFNLDDTLTVYNSSIANYTGSIIDYLNTSHGLQVCFQTGVSGSYNSISTGCSAPATAPLDLYLQDANGYQATIEIDPTSGFAKRLN